MKRALLSIALLAALVGAPAALAAQATEPSWGQAAVVSTPDPAHQLLEIAGLFRAGDVAGLARALLPPSHWEKVRMAYELKRLEPTSEEDRAEFAENLERLTASDAVDRLMAEIEPKLEEARPQAPGALLMAFGAMQMAINSPDSDLTQEQRTALKSAIPGLQRWAYATDFLDPNRMREALTLVTDAARRTGISDIEQVKALPLEQALELASPVLGAAKEAVLVYGIDLDAVADSLQVEVLDIAGDTARVRTTITLFEAPLSTEHELVLLEGRWYGKNAVLHMDPHHRHDG